MELSYAGDARGQHAEEPSQGTNGKGNGRQVGTARGGSRGTNGNVGNNNGRRRPAVVRAQGARGLRGE